MSQLPEGEDLIRGLEHKIEQLEERAKGLAKRVEEQETRFGRLKIVLGISVKSHHRVLQLGQIANARMRRAQKEYAALVLTVYENPMQIAEWCKKASQEVRDYVVGHHFYPRGKCAACDAHAPLVRGLCSWGCDKKPLNEDQLILQYTQEANEFALSLEAELLVLEKEILAGGITG